MCLRAAGWKTPCLVAGSQEVSESSPNHPALGDPCAQKSLDICNLRASGLTILCLVPQLCTALTSTPSMDHDSCLKVASSRPMYQESPLTLASRVLQPLRRCACLWLKNTIGEGDIQPCGNTTQALLAMHTFLTWNVVDHARVIQVHHDPLLYDDGVHGFLQRLKFCSVVLHLGCHFLVEFEKMIPSSFFSEFFVTFCPFSCKCLKPFTASAWP